LLLTYASTVRNADLSHLSPYTDDLSVILYYLLRESENSNSSPGFSKHRLNLHIVIRLLGKLGYAGRVDAQ
jgi:hypothetical protein